MTQVISPETAPSVIRDQSVKVDGHVYNFSLRDGRFYVELDDPTIRGARRERELLMMTGSHHMHVFWYESDFAHTPAQLPILYLKDQERWIPRRSAFLQPPDDPVSIELGRWNQTCAYCHSTHPRMRLQRETHVWDTHVAEFGISCEACHGPGQSHVQIYRAKNKGAGEAELAKLAKDMIVNPTGLPHRSRSDLCGQCHGVGLLDFAALSKEEYLQNGSPFRPGKAMADIPFCSIVQAGPDSWQTDTFKSFATSPEKLIGHFWPDGEVRVSGREYNGMIESSCFQQGEMACISCHTMHEQDLDRQQEWKNDQLLPDMQEDQACLQCHAEYKELGSKHTHHLIGSAGSACMNCHMPHTNYGLLKTIRSHRVSSPSVTTTIKTGRPNACNLCHLDQTLAWTSKHLANWYDHKQPKLTPDERQVSAAVLHLLKGDAGQRVIQASAFAWPPAQQASGTDWMAPLLLLAMNDPYEATRLIAERSLRSLSDWEDFQFDFLAPFEDRAKITGRKALQLTVPESAGRTELLYNETGKLNVQRGQRLVEAKKPIANGIAGVTITLPFSALRRELAFLQ